MKEAVFKIICIRSAVLVLTGDCGSTLNPLKKPRSDLTGEAFYWGDYFSTPFPA